MHVTQIVVVAIGIHHIVFNLNHIVFSHMRH